VGNKPGEQKRRRIQGLLASCLKRKARRRRRSHVVHERRMSSHNPWSLYHAQCCHCTTPRLTESFAVDQAASLKLTHKRNEIQRKKRNSRMRPFSSSLLPRECLFPSESSLGSGLLASLLAGGPRAMVLRQSSRHFALLFLCRIKPQGPRSQIMTPTLPGTRW
jgi:hypothetical protein